MSQIMWLIHMLFFQAINKSKKAKEVEQLLQENETLQMKLHSQEDDFRLQNETLMQELSQVGLWHSVEKFEMQM